MSRARKGEKGLDRVKVADADKRAHRARLAASRDETPRALVLDVLESALGQIAAMRARYGPHRDFDTVEVHQRRLIDALASGRAT